MQERKNFLQIAHCGIFIYIFIHYACPTRLSRLLALLLPPPPPPQSEKWIDAPGWYDLLVGSKAMHL